MQIDLPNFTPAAMMHSQVQVTPLSFVGMSPTQITSYMYIHVPPTATQITSYIHVPPTAFQQTSTSHPPLLIEKEKLIPSEHTLKLFARLKSKIHVGTLAVKLSRESSFEVKVMKLCTVAGWRDLPALPVVELGQLKELLFKQFPDYMLTEFEPLWSRCIESINQGARDFVKERSRVPDYYYLFNI